MGHPCDLVLGTAGHIDHGKSALVRSLTGVDPDRLPEEKSRGITVDLGFATLDLGGGWTLALVDVPGHERFIRNMLAGATGFDLALLVVAADDSVMPQTREHLHLLRLLGLRSGLVALTKCDLAEESWIDLVQDEVATLLAGTFLEGCPILRTSSRTGRGLEALKASLARLCRSAPPRDDPGPFRMAVDRSFTVAGHGTVVSGTVASGVASAGDELDWHAAGKRVRVRGLQRHERPVDRVARGARAALNLAGVRHTQVRRGDELAEPGYLSPSRVLTVEVAGMPAERPALRHRARYRLHLGTAEAVATLAMLGPEAGLADGPILAQLHVSRPVVAVHGEAFVLRTESPQTTVGGGRVLQPVARRVRRRDLPSLARIEGLRSPDAEVRVASALALLGVGAWTERSLCRDTGVAVRDIPGVLGRLKDSGSIVEVAAGPRGPIGLHRSVISELDDRIVRAVGRLHAANPRLSAVSRSRLAAELAYLKNEPLVVGLIDRLLSRGELVGDARAVASRGHEPSLSQAERRLKEEIARAYRDGGTSPPEPSEWAAKANPRAAAVPELLTLLCEEERIVAIGRGLYLDAEAEARVRLRVGERLRGGASLTMSELRDLLGTTRKYAVPIGEYLDRIGLTRREGDVRHLNVSADAPGVGPS